MKNDKSKAPWFKFYAKDWLSDGVVMAMTAEERGVYIQLLAMDWNDDGILDSDEALSLICKADVSVISTVVERSFAGRSTDGQRRSNGRLSALRLEAGDSHAQKVAAGKASAKAREAKRLAAANARSAPVQRPLNDTDTDTDTDTEPDKDPLKDGYSRVKGGEGEKGKPAPSGAPDASHGVPRSNLPTQSPKASDSESQTAKKRFQPPSESEVAEWFQSKGLSLADAYDEAETFWNHHSNNDWYIKNRKMKSWQMACVTWTKSELYKKRRGKGQQPGSKSGFTRNKGTFNGSQRSQEFFQRLDEGRE